MGTSYPGIDSYDMGGQTNQMQFAAFGSVQPLDTLTVDARYTHFRLAKAYVNTYTTSSVLQAAMPFDWTPATRSKHIGDEIDVLTTYDYTEDVQFSLLGSLFVPGDFFDDAGGGMRDPKAENNIHSIVSSVKVSF